MSRRIQPRPGAANAGSHFRSSRDQVATSGDNGQSFDVVLPANRVLFSGDFGRQAVVAQPHDRAVSIGRQSNLDGARAGR